LPPPVSLDVGRHEWGVWSMTRLIDLSNEEARSHFLKGSSYFNGDMPRYISFEPILADVSAILNGGDYAQFKAGNPADIPNVNYNFIANKDGKFAWRPLELRALL